MSFIRRNIYAVLVLVTAILSAVLWMQQEESRADAHVTMRENFLWAARNGNEEVGTYFFQRLIQSARKLSDKDLTEDFMRLRSFVQDHESDAASLPAKYMRSVNRLLEKRAEDRMAEKIKEFTAPNLE